MPHRRLLGAASLVLVATALPASSALARPAGPSLFCATYPTSPACDLAAVTCSYCHERTTEPVTWNLYGEALRAELGGAPLSDADFAAKLPGALAAIGAADADGDGVANEKEIFGGTLPGDAKSLPSTDVCPADVSAFDYRVCQTDYRYLLRKLSIDFCGYSPVLAELDAIAAADDATAGQMIDAALDQCIQGEYFRGPDGVLWTMAHRKIKPLSSVKSGEDPGIIPLADYDPDYALFVYSQIDDHDASSVLTADFFVARVPPKDATGVSKYIELPDIDGQNVAAARRAGLITSAWFLVTNVMFTALPRTAAAQFYRAYLGHDIAREEGLHPVPGEPKEYDAKGVTAAACAGCHSTLDPLSYPFRNYNGLGSGGRGKYVPNRIEKFFADEAPNITQIPEAGALFGEPEATLVDMAKAAADSDDFAIATVNDYWMLTVGAPPTPEQHDAFASLVSNFKANGYSVSKMLHELVHLEAYAAP
ncbi:MAG: hypothetical protein U0414_19820 [Polyangiaceae bacterium]